MSGPSSASLKYLDKLAEQEFGASADMLYKNALLPLKKDGQISVYKEGMDGHWYRRLEEPLRAVA